MSKQRVAPLPSDLIPFPGLWTGALVLAKGGNLEVCLERWTQNARTNGEWRLPLETESGELYPLNLFGLTARVASRVGVGWAHVSPGRIDSLCSLILNARWFPGCPHDEAAWEEERPHRWKDWALILSTASIYLATLDRLRSLPVWDKGMESSGIPAFIRKDDGWVFTSALDCEPAAFDYVAHMEDWRLALQAVLAKEADDGR